MAWSPLKHHLDQDIIDTQFIGIFSALSLDDSLCSGALFVLTDKALVLHSDIIFVISWQEVKWMGENSTD